MLWVFFVNVRQILNNLHVGNGLQNSVEILVFNTVFLSICEITISGQLVEFAVEKPVMQHKTTIVQLLWLAMAFATFITGFILVKTAISPNDLQKENFYFYLVLVELAILQTIIICGKTTWAYQVQDNWNLNTTRANEPPGPISMIANQNQGRTVRSHVLHSSLAYAQLCCTFYQPLVNPKNMQE